MTGYTIYNGSTQLGTATTTTYSATGLTPNTTYTITAKAKDAAGNISAASSMLSIKTLADTTAPSTPTLLASSAITVNSFTLAWTASTDNVGVTSYDIYKNGTLAGNATTASFGVSGLAPSTAFSMTVKAKDAAGNVSAASTALSVTTTADTTAPSIPAGLASSSVTPSTFALSWTASTDNVGVASYDIYRNGTLAGNATTTSFGVTGLVPSTAYSMTVKAKDTAGNVSVGPDGLGCLVNHEQ